MKTMIIIIIIISIIIKKFNSANINISKNTLHKKKQLIHIENVGLKFKDLMRLYCQFVYIEMFSAKRKTTKEI